MTGQSAFEALAAVMGDVEAAVLLQTELADVDAMQFAQMVEALARLRTWQASLERADGVLARAIAKLLRDFRAGFWPVEVAGVGVVELAPAGDSRTVTITGGRL
jgi:hypothetical protein